MVNSVERVESPGVVYEKNSSKSIRKRNISPEAEKTNSLASTIKTEVTSTSTWKTAPDIKEFKAENEELKSRNEQLADKVEEFTKQLKYLQDTNQELIDKLARSEDKANCLKVELDEIRGSQNLTASAIASTEVRNSVSELQEQLTQLCKDIEVDIKNVDEILSGKNSEDNTVSLKENLEKFESLYTSFQNQYIQSETNFHHAIEQRNSMSNHWNLDRILLSKTEQGKKYLNLFNKYYNIMFTLNSEIKKLQLSYDALVGNDYRNEQEFNSLKLSISGDISPDKRLSDAKTEYLKLDETKKKELLQSDYKTFSTKLDEIKKQKSKLDASNENTPSDIKVLFNSIETEIKKTSGELSKDALAPFEIYRKSVEDSLKETLTKNAKNLNELYHNLRKWVSPNWNESLNMLKMLETEIQLLGDRELFHQIQHSHNKISLIKGMSKGATSKELNDLSKLFFDEYPGLRLAHITYYEITDSYEKSIALLSTKIADLKGEKTLKQDLEEYSINEFTTKELVIGQLIKTMTQQKVLIVNQKKTIEEKWDSLLLQLYNTSNDLQKINAGGSLSVNYLAGSYIGTNPYIGIHTELSARPVKPKAESAAVANS